MLSEKDYKYMNLAEQIAKNATCNLLQVDCVIVKDEKVIAVGYNAAIIGYPPCEEAGHVLSDDGRCMRQIHAEMNALFNGKNEDLAGATAYVTLEPCDTCTKMLNQSGIKKVIFKEKFANPYNRHFIEPMEWICLEDL